MLCPGDPELRRRIESLRGQIHAQPEDLDARLRLAQCLAQDGAFAEGERTLRDCIEMAGDRDTLGGIFFNLGVCRESAGELERAAMAYEQARFLCPWLLWARLRLGIVLHRLGRHEGAVRELKQVANLDEDDAEVQFALAEALRALGRLRDARAAYLEAARLRPAHLDTWRALEALDHCVQ